MHTVMPFRRLPSNWCENENFWQGRKFSMSMCSDSCLYLKHSVLYQFSTWDIAYHERERWNKKKPIDVRALTRTYIRLSEENWKRSNILPWLASANQNKRGAIVGYRRKIQIRLKDSRNKNWMKYFTYIMKMNFQIAMLFYLDKI